ncbi:MAG: hypothetical protein JST12_12275 [Armatimonadetes bacterium]|nr:hypothetical protein [Armatimonadota bacterium]
MFCVLLGAVLQTPAFFLLDETPGEATPAQSGGTLVYTVDVKIIGRKAKVILDTKARALPYMLEETDKPTNLLEFAIKGLGRKGERIVAEPESGTVAFVKVLEIKRV